MVNSTTWHENPHADDGYGTLLDICIFALHMKQQHLKLMKFLIIAKRMLKIA